MESDVTEFEAEILKEIRELTEAIYHVGDKICESNGMIVTQEIPSTPISPNGDI